MSVVLWFGTIVICLFTIWAIVRNVLQGRHSILPDDEEIKQIKPIEEQIKRSKKVEINISGDDELIEQLQEKISERDKIIRRLQNEVLQLEEQNATKNWDEEYETDTLINRLAIINRGNQKQKD